MWEAGGPVASQPDSSQVPEAYNQGSGFPLGVPLRSSGLLGFGLAALPVRHAAGRSPGPRRDEVSAALVLTPVTSLTAARNPGSKAQLER